MKKLFLFILILFGMLSVQSLADGCNAQICTCPNGSWVSFGQYCPIQNTTYSAPSESYGAIAFDPVTGSSGFSVENYNIKTAETYALNQCNSASCKIIGTFKTERCGSLAYSDSDKIYGYKTSSRGGRKNLNKKSLNECEKNGGKNCKVIISTCGYDGLLIEKFGTQTGPVYPK